MNQPTKLRGKGRMTVLAGLLALWVAAPIAAGESPWYVEGKLGEGNLDTTFGRVFLKTYDDESGVSSIEIGRRVNRYLSVQAGLHDLGDYVGTGAPCRDSDDFCVATVTEEQLALGLCIEGAVCPLVAVPLGAEVDAWSLALIPRWPVTERLSLRGRVGWTDWEAEVSGLFSLPTTERFTGSDTALGVGAEWTFPNGLGVLAEYTDSEPGLTISQLGMSWRF